MQNCNIGESFSWLSAFYSLLTLFSNMFVILNVTHQKSETRSPSGNGKEVNHLFVGLLTFKKPTYVLILV